MTIEQMYQFLNEGGVLAVAIFYIAGFYLEAHVTGRQHRRLEDKCSALEAAAYTNIALAQDLVALIKELDPDRGEDAQRAVNSRQRRPPQGNRP